MLIIDVLPHDFPKRKLIIKGFEDYSIEEFLYHFDQLSKNGGNINFAYQQAIDYIKENFNPANPSQANISKTQTHSMPTEIEIKLKQIPIDELKLYYPKKTLDGVIPKLSSLGFNTIADLYQKPICLKRKNDIKLGNDIKKIVVENYDIIIKNWDEASQIIELPSKKSNNPIEDALIELSQIAQNRLNQLRRWDDIKETTCTRMHLAFVEKNSLDEIAKKIGRSKESVRQTIMDDILKPFLSGNLLFNNIKLKQDIIEKLNQLKSDYIFKEDYLATNLIGEDISENVSKVLGIDFIDIIEGVKFTIPIDTKITYNKVLSITLNELRDAIEFKNASTIFEKVINHEELSHLDFDSQFINNILLCEKIVRLKDDKVQIHEHLLSTNEQRIARIIYDINIPVTREKVLEIYKSKYGINITTGFSILDKYGIKNTKSNLWEYVGDAIENIAKLEPIEQRVAEYAKNIKCFHFNDLIKWLTEQNYIISTESTIRTYITNVCTPSNNDNNLFCHKDFTGEFPQYKWREIPRDGLSNWILTQLNTMYIDSNSESLKMSDIIKYIEDKSTNTEYNHRIRERIKFVINAYSGEDFPFLIRDEYVLKNLLVHQNTNFDIIGFRGRNLPYYSQIRALASNALKHTEDGRLKLVDFIKMVNDSGFDKTLNRKTIINAIESTRLPNCNVILKTYDNIKYLENIQPISNDEVSTEPNYIVAPSNEDINIIKVVENNQLTERSNIIYRQPIDWDKLTHALNLELSYYNNWFQNECDHDVSYGVDLFISYIKQSNNNNLNHTLPRNLFEYWYAHIDNYDRSTYLSNISIFYEALLTDIQRRKGYDVPKSGLYEISMNFPYLRNAYTLDFREAKGFAKIFKNLSYQRNKYAHGNAVELSARGIAQSIADFIALYVFTIVKYA